ncbi:MAG: anthranilate phosphoribosyltransferase [Planctomycetota bacterium]|nr:anthranilate phosphoribosyltransferase [Planctomycetota bacterium]
MNAPHTTAQSTASSTTPSNAQFDAKPILARLLTGGTLSAPEARQVFEHLLAGRMDPLHIASLLSLIQQRGATVEELAGAARVMRDHVTPVPVPASIDPDAVLDTCGTGGATKAFNVSTASAIVVASARGKRRLYVAKHGNRGRSGRGSAEVLHALGVKLDASPDVEARCLVEVGVCFCFAVAHHPAMKQAAPVRQALGFPTIFNLLGPLTNPARAARQIMGVPRATLVEPVARVLASLGATRALVVHGLAETAGSTEPLGMDEISACGPTTVGEVRGTDVQIRTLDAASSVGMARIPLESVSCGDLPSAVEMFRHAISGEHPNASELVALNAAAALVVGEAAETWQEGVSLAREAIASGRAAQTLERLRQVSSA